MGCYHPIPASDQGGEIKLWPPVGTATLELPCSQCLGCLTDRATSWARRAEHEATLYHHNCFLTLTYREHPHDLQPQHLALFLKRLRAAHTRNHPDIDRTPPTGLRYLACGEYGTERGRPHYHVLLFNCDFRDAYRVAKDLRESPLLNHLWPHGQHRLGTLTGASANYVAQYTLKKLGSGTEHDTDGVVLTAPFLRASLKPALGAQWIQKYKRDIQHGYLVSNGIPGRIPTTYKRLLKRDDPELYAELLKNAQRSQTAKQRPGSAGDADPPDFVGRSKPNRQSFRQRQTDNRTRRRLDAETIHHSRNSLHNQRKGIS